MNFSKKQKIAIIFSMWLFFLWMVAISLVMRADFKGNLYDCIAIYVVGMLFAVFFYALVFVDKYFVTRYLKDDADKKRVKSMKRTAYIAMIYIDIVGFFFMTLSSLLFDSSKVKVVPFGVLAAITFVALFVTLVIGERRILRATKTLFLQEQNNNLAD
ncbi:MAG: hypothetical protein K2O08_03700 [Clostridia bacterium]|nr:hypothetical protein [Clostridia bacterium]